MDHLWLIDRSTTTLHSLPIAKSQNIIWKFYSSGSNWVSTTFPQQVSFPRLTIKIRHSFHLTTNLLAPDFSFDNQNGTVIPYNNIPIGFAPTKSRLFITVPRRAPGIPSTLNYIDLSARNSQQSPLLRSFPDIETNRLDASTIIR